MIHAISRTAGNLAVFMKIWRVMRLCGMIPLARSGTCSLSSNRYTLTLKPEMDVRVMGVHNMQLMYQEQRQSAEENSLCVFALLLEVLFMGI